VVREDEDLGGGYGVEPAFDPAPDCGEEGGGADYLFLISAPILQIKYK
jgi:hypothetical protein